MSRFCPNGMLRLTSLAWRVSKKSQLIQIEKQIVKSKIISLCLVLALLPTSAILPLSAMAADNGGLSERAETRAQRALLPENGVNNLSPQTAQQQSTQISRSQASNLASDLYEGRVRSILLDNNNWRVRMDREGTVFDVFVNANSGAVSAPSD